MMVLLGLLVLGLGVLLLTRPEMLEWVDRFYIVKLPSYSKRITGVFLIVFGLYIMTLKA